MTGSGFTYAQPQTVVYGGALLIVAGNPLRQLLMAAALEGAPAAVAAFRDGRGSVAPNLFVHTSYFEDPDVTRLVALHISATATGAVDHHDGTDDDTARWLAAHRATVHAKLREFFARAS
jgi:hypothetical protein